MRAAPPAGLSHPIFGTSSEESVKNRGGQIWGNRNAGSVATAKTNAAFVHVAPKSMPLPVLIAVPHAGRAYPDPVLVDMRDPSHCQLRLEDRLVDALGIEIARGTGTGLLVAHAPRAMIDLNRAHDDVDWEMVEPAQHQSPQTGTAHHKSQHITLANARARSGLGLIPRRLSGFGEIWRKRVRREELDRRIDRIHRPYHAFLSQELERIRDEWGAALLIDLHSMPPLKRKAGQDRAPKIVLGDRFGTSCHSNLVVRAFHYLEKLGCAVAHNRPYSGGYVLDRHCLLYTSPSPRDQRGSRMPSSA